MTLKICVVGASGQMGKEIVKAITLDQETELYSAIERPGSENIEKFALDIAGCGTGGCRITPDIVSAAKNADVIIDFSGAAGTMANIKAYQAAGRPAVIGSTGLTDAHIAELKGLSKQIPLVVDSNMSVGVNVMTTLVEMAARALDSSFDIEIFEAHHRYKKDAPSGTALMLGNAAAEGRKEALANIAAYTRKEERRPGSIGFQVLRGGDIAGDHTVFFCGDGERIEITHRASTRAIFAKGALRAAKWLSGKSNGYYEMKNVLGL